jgi:aerobic carbon-monoxide dehydrogenase medium subunit
MRYEAPETLKAAAKILAGAKGTSRVLAGGTDLLVQMRSGLIEPDLVVDIKKIPELRKVTLEKGGFRVGAAVSGAELEEHSKFGKVWPGVLEAFELIGSTQIQGRCTMAGNLCNASPAADSVPAMIAAGAIARVVGPKGRRDVPVEKIPASPGKTTLKKGEFIASIFFPKRPPKSSDAYLRFIPRTEMDIAVVGVGVSLTVNRGGTITDARVSLGAVAPTVLVVPAAAKALIGSKLEDEALEKAAAAASAACKPINDKRGTIEYRTKVAGVMTRRAAQIAYDRARGEK